MDPDPCNNEPDPQPWLQDSTLPLSIQFFPSYFSRWSLPFGKQMITGQLVSKDSFKAPTGAKIELITYKVPNDDMITRSFGPSSLK